MPKPLGARPCGGCVGERMRGGTRGREMVCVCVCCGLSVSWLTHTHTSPTLLPTPALLRATTLARLDAAPAAAFPLPSPTSPHLRRPSPSPAPLLGHQLIVLVRVDAQAGQGKDGEGDEQEEEAVGRFGKGDGVERAPCVKGRGPGGGAQGERGGGEEAGRGVGKRGFKGKRGGVLAVAAARPAIPHPHPHGMVGQAGRGDLQQVRPGREARKGEAPILRRGDGGAGRGRRAVGGEGDGNGGGRDFRCCVQDAMR